MQSVYFDGSKEIKKPENMTDEECMSAWAMMVPVPRGKSPEGEDIFSSMFVLHYMPSKEDIEAINSGRGIWLQLHQPQLSPHAVFTIDKNGNSNDAG